MQWCLDFLLCEGQGIETHHERFKVLVGAKNDSWGIHEHWQQSQQIRQAAEVDQLDLVNLLSVEMGFRRLQTIEFSYAEKAREEEGRGSGPRLTAEEQAAFAGSSRAHSGLMVCPALLDWVRQEAERDASLAKNLRKAREEREASRKAAPKKGAQGS